MDSEKLKCSSKVQVLEIFVQEQHSSKLAVWLLYLKFSLFLAKVAVEEYKTCDCFCEAGATKFCTVHVWTKLRLVSVSRGLLQVQVYTRYPQLWPLIVFVCLCDKHSSTVLKHQLFTFTTRYSSLKYPLSIRPWETEATSRRSTNNPTPRRNICIESRMLSNNGA